MRRSLVLAVVLVAGLVAVWLWSSGRPPPVEPHSGILAPLDLAAGDFALLVRLGLDMPAAPGEHQAWLIEDQGLIAAHRDAIDIAFNFVDFLPGEGRGGIYLYVFKDGLRIAGRVATLADQIKVPAVLLDSARLVERQSFFGNRAETLAELDRLLAAGALIDASNAPDPASPANEFYFRAWLPTIAVSDDSDFDVEAYGATLAERIRALAPAADYMLAVSLAIEQPPGTAVFVGTDGWSLEKAPDGTLARLNGVRLYTYAVDVESDPALYEAFAAIDLAALVADQRNSDLIVAGWKQATGASVAPAEIRLDDYQTGTWGRLTERSYSLTSWR